MEEQSSNPEVDKSTFSYAVNIPENQVPHVKNATQNAPSAPLLPPGYYPSKPATNNFVPSYGSTESTTIEISNIAVVGGCPACRAGVMEDDFTCLGLLCAIFCFPIGIICCLLLKTRRCSNCGAYFG